MNNLKRKIYFQKNKQGVITLDNQIKNDTDFKHTLKDLDKNPLEDSNNETNNNNNNSKLLFKKGDHMISNEFNLKF